MASPECPPTAFPVGDQLLEDQPIQVLVYHDEIQRLTSFTRPDGTPYTVPAYAFEPATHDDTPPAPWAQIQQ